MISRIHQHDVPQSSQWFTQNIVTFLKIITMIFGKALSKGENLRRFKLETEIAPSSLSAKKTKNSAF